MTVSAGERPRGVTLLTIFFLFGALMAGVTALLLLFPGTAMDALWRLNPQAREGFVAIGKTAVLMMLIVCAACATTAAGLWRSTRWGYWMALAILSLDIVGDTLNSVVNRDWRTLIGLPIGGLLIVYLHRNRRVFRSNYE